ncbi:MAG: hypothetical protein OXF50_11560 [Caldilineaceae bacterium]|nr:hypothetical protein [Caldilineaceae bacterium]
MAGDFKRMKLTGKDKVLGLVLAGVVLSYFIWDFQGAGLLIMLAITLTFLLALSFAVPRQHRSHIVSILSVGMGGTIVIGIVYVFGLHGPDIYGSREWLEDFKPIESALLVWGVTAFCVMLDGPYGAYARDGREDKEA